MNGKVDILNPLFEDKSANRSPPQATIARRANSYSDFYHVVRAHITKDARKVLREERQKNALGIPTSSSELSDLDATYVSGEEHFSKVVQEEYQYVEIKIDLYPIRIFAKHCRLYSEQLALTERHLDTLLEDTSSALGLLATLSESFRSVESQTSVFQSQCEGLLDEQRRLRTLGEEIGEGLQYYSYLEPITRRLNAPGASRAIGDDSFVEMLFNLEACIDYMTEHVSWTHAVGRQRVYAKNSSGRSQGSRNIPYTLSNITCKDSQFTED